MRRVIFTNEQGEILKLVHRPGGQSAPINQPNILQPIPCDSGVIGDSGITDNNNFNDQLLKITGSCPATIKNIVQKFFTAEERVMALYSSVTLTGSLMPYFQINYDNKINYPGLMVLAIFPPASGKGGMSLIRKLGQKINVNLLKQFEGLMTQYRLDEDLYKRSLKTQSPLLPPKQPVQPMFLIPGDITSAKLTKQLSDNGPDQFVTIFETEVDVFGNSSSNSQFGAGLSTTVRQAFHHEPISQMRKTNSELLVADTPKLAMVLSGTLNQVTKIFKSNEDGMYSRFLIIFGNAPAKWKDVKPNPTLIPLDDWFEYQADDYFKMWQFFKDKKVSIKFTDKQWNKINAFGERYLAITHHFTDEQTGSIAKRHANMLTRIGAILTGIRYYENNDSSPVKFCADEDFEIATWMAERSLNWSLELYKQLPGRSTRTANEQKLKVMSVMPDEFELKQVLELNPGFKVSDRTVNRLMAEFVDAGLLTKIGYGKYKKTDMSQLALSHFEKEENE